ncbi:hypothetical protein [Montanilutibacter psychrotolerans]|uniref:hypothetical protein n=1 Tax=Montanilutibacter psychrotolerans TaxID=1327343 RepID=UPI001CC202CF|nr:hypothetical protein [Lysobacter psychrotolerans]
MAGPAANINASGDASAGSGTARRPRRRAAWALLALLLAVALSLHWVSRPDRLAGLILNQAGSALGLDITASGASQYRLRGTPMLMVRDLVAREPGATTPVLRAERVLLELPWSTIRARGTDLTVQRIELDAPQLDLAALQHWQAGRPPSETRIPTLTRGLRVVRGQLVGDGWSLQALTLDLPKLHPKRAVRAALSGRLDSNGTRVPFQVQAALSGPTADAALGLAGTASVEQHDWRLPMRLRLSGRLANDANGIGLDAMRLAAPTRYLSGDTDLPFVYAIAGNARYRDARLSIAPLGAALRGTGVVPHLDARGRFAWQDGMGLQLVGAIARWPDAWPALPPPIGQSDAALPFVLHYQGPADLSATTTLQLQRDGTRFDGRFRLPEVLEWIDATGTGAPLPPIEGRLVTPRMEVSGAVLEGVEIEFEEVDDNEEPGP